MNWLLALWSIIDFSSNLHGKFLMGQPKIIFFAQKFGMAIFFLLFLLACKKEIIDDTQINGQNNRVMVRVWYEDENKHLVHDKEANIYLYPEFDFIYQQCTYEWNGVFKSRGVQYFPTRTLRVDDSSYIYIDQEMYKQFLLVIECRYKNRISTYYKLGKDPMESLTVTFK